VAMDQDTAIALLQAQLVRTHQLKAAPLENLVIDNSEKFRVAMAMNDSRNAALRREARLYTLLLISSVAVALMALLGLWLWLKRRNERMQSGLSMERYQRELAELSLRNQQLENEQLNHALEMSRRDVTDFAIVHTQRRKIFEEVVEGLKRLRQSEHQDRGLQDLINGLRAKMDAEESISLDAQRHDLVNNAFFDKLRRTYPGLSPAELELCSMLRLGYSVKEIAAIRNIEPASVRIGKTRLKKKLGLGPDEQLNHFLATF
jgi:DNA-binding CsgD family transcriptional regulator